MPKTFIDDWLALQASEDVPKNIKIFRERADQRSLVMDALRGAVLDHLIGASIIESIGGFKAAARVIRNALPTSKISRSGEFGEILATEYVDQSTDYVVPIRRLRYKDDRQMAMRGDDVLGFIFETTPAQILKAEAKSRVNLTEAALKDANNGLCRHQGRPNPSTLSFISRRLREAGKHATAKRVEQLQEGDIPLKSISHLIFTLSANDPSDVLTAHSASTIAAITRQITACIIEDHAAFIEQLYESTLKGVESDGND